MTYVATTAAVTGEMVRDLMTESVEQRFGRGALRTSHAIEWLSDNGPPYTAHETREFGRSLGLVVCTTPAYSPESNGMAECFVKPSNADSGRKSDLSSARCAQQEKVTRSARLRVGIARSAGHRPLLPKAPRTNLFILTSQVSTALAFRGTC
jgi:transposase InsO family protein